MSSCRFFCLLVYLYMVEVVRLSTDKPWNSSLTKGRRVRRSAGTTKPKGNHNDSSIATRVSITPRHHYVLLRDSRTREQVVHNPIQLLIGFVPCKGRFRWIESAQNMAVKNTRWKLHQKRTSATTTPSLLLPSRSFKTTSIPKAGLNTNFATALVRTLTHYAVT